MLKKALGAWTQQLTSCRQPCTISLGAKHLSIRWLIQQVKQAFKKNSQKQLLSHARCPCPGLTECLYTSASKPSMPLQPAHPCRLRKTFVGEQRTWLLDSEQHGDTAYT